MRVEREETTAPTDPFGCFFFFFFLVIVVVVVVGVDAFPPPPPPPPPPPSAAAAAAGEILGPLDVTGPLGSLCSNLVRPTLGPVGSKFYLKPLKEVNQASISLVV